MSTSSDQRTTQPDEPVELQGKIFTESGDPIRGKPEVVMQDGTRYPFVVVPSDLPNQYEFARRHL
jgi:hypothetical protein